MVVTEMKGNFAFFHDFLFYYWRRRTMVVVEGMYGGRM